MDELRLAPYVLYSSLDYQIAINFFNMSDYGRCGGEREDCNAQTRRLKDWVLIEITETVEWSARVYAKVSSFATLVTIYFL